MCLWIVRVKGEVKKANKEKKEQGVYRKRGGGGVQQNLYCRMGFNCERLIIANCEFSFSTQRSG